MQFKTFWRSVQIIGCHRKFGSNRNWSLKIAEPPLPPGMRGVVVNAALALTLLAPSLVAAEDAPQILGDVIVPEIWNSQPQRGDIVATHEVSKCFIIELQFHIWEKNNRLWWSKGEHGAHHRTLGRSNPVWRRLRDQWPWRWVLGILSSRLQVWHLFIFFLPKSVTLPPWYI